MLFRSVGFLEEKDYEDPESRDLRLLYHSCASNGRVIIEWTPGNKRDEEVVSLIEEFVNKQKAEFTTPFPSGNTAESMGGFSTADTLKGKDTPGKSRDVKKRPYQTKLF